MDFHFQLIRLIYNSTRLATDYFERRLVPDTKIGQFKKEEHRVKALQKR